MSESDVKVLLKSIKKLKAKKEILSCVKKEDDEYEKLSKIIYMIESSLEILKMPERMTESRLTESRLEILNESEREVLQMHLIDELTWEQVVTQYEKCHGKQNGYCKRTYERIQRKALKRIREVIENSELEEFIVNYI